MQLHDAPWRWKVGLEASLAMGLPVGLFTLAGHQPLGLQAALGSFTALYAAGLHRPDRARVLPFVALGLLLAAALGIACAGNAWLTTACLIAVSALACTLSLGFRLGPPGPMMFVLVAAVSNHLTAPASLGGVALPGLRLLGLIALGSTLAYLVIVAPLILPSARRAASVPAVLPALPSFELTAEAIAIGLRVVIAVTVACLVSRPLGAFRTYWVVLSAIAVLQSSYSRRLTSIQGVHRMIGTVAGVLVFELLSLLHPAGLGIVLLLMLLQGATEVVVARNYALALLFITPMALINSTAGHAGDTLVTVQGRILDSLLGSGLALAVFWAGEGLQRLQTSLTKASRQ
ncbi:FUSC family protein [Hymenobacter jejuensis]|uniref:FUSC family protein n=1 Tax=Hymenobacter jejuensis TaxID=2502781 RepID=UPI0013FD0F03|nr:FUSC family protein [Hymenobacter jejuensis]